MWGSMQKPFVSMEESESGMSNITDEPFKETHKPCDIVGLVYWYILLLALLPCHCSMWILVFPLYACKVTRVPILSFSCKGAVSGFCYEKMKYF